jgi:hypothetical protein
MSARVFPKTAGATAVRNDGAEAGGRWERAAPRLGYRVDRPPEGHGAGGVGAPCRPQRSVARPYALRAVGFRRPFQASTPAVARPKRLLRQRCIMRLAR